MAPTWAAPRLFLADIVFVSAVISSLYAFHAFQSRVLALTLSLD